MKKRKKKLCLFRERRVIVNGVWEALQKKEKKKKNTRTSYRLPCAKVA